MIQGRTGEWEIVIGLEVHAQIVAEAKLFSGAATAFGAEPNTQVSTIDAAFPGMLPVINRHCVEQAVKTGHALKGTVNSRSVFDRKNYFYPDLPAGYQISQYQQPIVTGGRLALDMPDGSTREIRITRLHLEQDAGKSLHDQHPRETYVDLNRAGIGLMEIVSEPDLRSAEEAGIYLRKLRSILRYYGTCDGNMEEGSLRCDCNVSVRKPGQPFGTRCEIKNLNSVRFVMQAIEIEARRQVDIIEDGGTIAQETRLFDTGRAETRPMRSKENDYDYRYFPDPDLLPLVLEREWIAKLKDELGEFLEDRVERYVRDDRIRPEIAARLVDERPLADFLDAARMPKRDMAAVANWVVTETLALLVKHGLTVEQWGNSPPVSADQTGVLIDLVSESVITRQNAKDLHAEMFDFNRTAAIMSAAGMAFDQRPPEASDFRELAEIRGLRQVTDTGAIEAAVDAALAANPAQVAQYATNPKVLGFFVGQVMKATQGKANPALVNEILKNSLSSRLQKQETLRPRETCVFCGNSDLSHEHVWADWLEPYVPRVFTHTNHTVSRSAISLFSDERHHQQEKGILTGPGDPHEKQLRIVCKSCNNIWMSQLQNRIKPILTPLIAGSWTKLSLSDQRVLAAWATMYTMVVEFADLGTLITPSSQRDEFQRTQIPPAGWAVWIGAFEGELWRGVFNHFGWGLPLVSQSPVSPDVTLAAKYDTQSTAFVLGKVFFMTFSTIRPGFRIEERSFADRFGLRCIWPVSDDPVNPPDQVLDDLGADAISSSLQPHPSTAIRRAWQP